MLFRRSLPLLATLLFVATPLKAQEPTPTLYERLGGIYPIAVVVDDFIERLLVNDIINSNQAVAAARERVPAPGLKYQLTSMVCNATGGPCNYIGRSMEESHAHLNINAEQWQMMVALLRQTLTSLEVPDAEQDELVAIVESTKAEIVKM